MPARFPPKGKKAPRRLKLIAHHSTRVVVAGISQYQSAMDYLERALLRYYPEPASIEHEPAFAKIRTKARFKRIMQHYFSEKSP